MKQDVKTIEKAYNMVADVYVQEYADEHAKKPMDQDMLARFAREIGDRQPVWDLGCGPGHTAAYLKNIGVEVSGLDLSEEMLAQASYLHPDIHFRKGNLLNLNFKDNSIAGAVAFYAIVHFTMDQVEQTFHEIFRVMKPGGLLLLTYHMGEEVLHIDTFLGRNIAVDFMFHTADSVSDCLKKSGFEKIETIERDPYPDVEYASRRAYVFAAKLNVV